MVVVFVVGGGGLLTSEQQVSELVKEKLSLMDPPVQVLTSCLSPSPPRLSSAPVGAQTVDW